MRVLPSTQREHLCAGLGQLYGTHRDYFRDRHDCDDGCLYFRNDFGAEPGPGRPWCLPPSGADGSRLAVRSDTQLTLEMLSQPLLWRQVTVTSAATGTNLWSHCVASLAPTGSPLQLAICIGFSALIFVWIEGEKLFIRLVQAWRSR